MCKVHKLTRYGNRYRCRRCFERYAKKYNKSHKVEAYQRCKEWRNRNREYFNQLTQQYWRATKAFIWGLKSNPCTDCGQWLNPWQMQFDHMPQFKKNKEINAAWNGTDKDLFTELAKCQLVCSNCHEHRSYLRRLI